MAHRPLDERVLELEERVARLERQTGTVPLERRGRAEPARATPVATPPDREAVPRVEPEPVPAPAPAPRPPAPTVAAAAATPRPPVGPPIAPSSAPARPRGLRLPHVNVPAVLGVVISLLGFSFLLKLAIDQGWLRLSIETRHILVELAGAAFVAAGWHQRVRRVAFSRALMGGGIATLCLTIYSAVLVFRILDGRVGFGLLLAVVALAAALATRLRSRVLATLGLVGGLAAPVLIPEGSAALAAVLGYYALFAAATLALAFRHSWPAFNLLSFAGIFGCSALYTVAGRWSGSPATPVELALVGLLFACGLGTALVSHLRRGGDALRGVELSLVLGVPSATLGLLALNDLSNATLAAWSVAMAAAYAVAARWGWRTGGGRSLVHPLVAVACGLVTLAVPLALDGEWVVVAWAAGAAVQIRLARRLGLHGHLVAGVGLTLFAALYQLVLLTDVAQTAPLFRHGIWISGVWAALLAVLSSWWIDRGRGPALRFPEIAWLPFAAGAALWIAVTGNEILRAGTGADGLAWFGLFVAATCAAALGLAAATGWRKLDRANVLFAPFTLVMLAAWVVSRSHPAAALGWAFWPAALAVLGAVVARMESTGSRLAAPSLCWLHAAVLAVVGWEAYYRLALVLDGVWAPAIVASALSLVTLAECRRLGHLPLWRDAIMPTTLVATFAMNVGLQASRGWSPPLGFVPLLNPVDVAAILFGATLWTLGRRRGEQRTGLVVAAVALACGTMTVLRAVHWYAEVPFTAADLAGSMVAQASLTVLWAASGLGGMIAGAARGIRASWIGGACLMGVVVAKLFTVDLGGVNTGARIVSFLGVGALLLAVGYFAPVPPRLREMRR